RSACRFQYWHAASAQRLLRAPTSLQGPPAGQGHMLRPERSCRLQSTRPRPNGLSPRSYMMRTSQPHLKGDPARLALQPVESGGAKSRLGIEVGGNLYAIVSRTVDTVRLCPPAQSFFKQQDAD